MFQKLISSFVFVLVLVAGSATSALAYTSPGTPEGYVNDFAQVLSPENEDGLEQTLTDFEASDTSEIAVVTVPTLGTDETIESYAVKLFEEYGIGQAKADNGVLLVLAIEDRKIRIEVGYGLEGALPDSVAASIISEVTQYLKDGDYDTAVARATARIIEATRGEYVASATGASDDWNFAELLVFLFYLVMFLPQWIGAILARTSHWWLGGIIGLFLSVGIALAFAFPLVVGAVMAVIMTLLGLLLDYVISKEYKQTKERGEETPWWAGGSLGSGSGGSSSSGGSFGGGSSGGGGASGSW